MEEQLAYAYLDYAAMAPLCQEALDAMEPWMHAGSDPSVLLGGGMNPNSLHRPGRNAFKGLEQSRRTVAEAIGADRPATVVFTSGATESDNAALQGIARAAREEMRRAGDTRRPLVITSAIEHDAVLECAKELSRDGFATELLDVDRDGFVEVRTLERVLEDAESSGDVKPVLVSVQTANSEIGSIQPIAQLCECTHGHDAYFHTDATQALGKTEVDVEGWGVDAASFSSHKVSGPRGIGALYLRSGVPMRPLLAGGGQEGAKRSGTQDVCSAAGFAAAARAAASTMEVESARLRLMRDELYERLGAIDPIQPTVQVDPGSLDYLPNIASFLFVGFESNTLVVRYDALGFAVSGGSACSSTSTGASHVLKAIGVPPDQALGELRVSMGRFTTQAEVDGFLRATLKVLDW